MRNDWVDVSYTEVIDRIPTTNIKTKQKDYLEQGLLPIIDQGQQLIGGFTNNLKKKVNCTLPVIVFGDHTKEVKFISFDFAPGADGTVVLQPKLCYLGVLLQYFTQVLTYKISDKGYARHFQHLKKEIIPLPPLPEQRAIVAKLELLFSELDNAVESLKTARKKIELYRQSVLKKAFEGLKKEKLKENCELVSGQHIKKGFYNYNETGIPYLTGPADFGKIYPLISKWTENEKAISITDDVLITVKGAGVGKVNINNVKIVAISRQLMAVKSERYDCKFIYFYFLSKYQELQKLGQGSTVPGIDRKTILEFQIPNACLYEQQKIVEEIESRLTVADRQLDIIDSSIEKAEALRQSILKRAFEGQLLSESELEATRLEPDWEPAEKLLQRIKDENKTKTTKSRTTKKKTTKKMTPVEMEALIVCRIIDAHQKFGNPEMVNHVKCEKIVHLAEYHAGFELERIPFKDAAGPNDFIKVHRVQTRAKMAGYFTKTKEGIVTTYFADRNIGKAISKLHEKVDKDKLDRLQQIIDDFISFDKVESEVPVTVYAAWNNLLLQNKETTDEAIVFEARENWHKNKMRIPRDKFFSALEWLREKNYIPTGNGIIIEKRDKDK